MKFNIVKNANSKVNKNEVNINLQFNEENKEMEKFIEYIKKYNNSILVQKDYLIKEIFYNDILFFFSKEKFNYCKTAEDTYRIKSKLYEVEKISENFMRISKNSIVNIEHVRNFDISKTGKIQVILDNDMRLDVSRRKIRDVLEFFDERII